MRTGEGQQRTIRVTAGGIRRSWPAHASPRPSSPDRFARRILRRYTARIRPAPHADLLVLRVRPGITIQHLTRHVSLRFNPYIPLVIRHQSPNAVTIRVVHHRGTGAGGKRVDRWVVHHRAANAPSPRNAEHLADRLVSRGVRVDTISLPARGKVSPRPPANQVANNRAASRWAPLAIPIPMTVRRAASATPADDQRAAGAEDRVQPTMPAGGQGRPGPGERALAFDVHRLADEVVQVIDRRIVSQRERMGRM